MTASVASSVNNSHTPVVVAATDEKKPTVIVIQNDQSVLKGLIWGYFGLVTGSVALAGAKVTAFVSILDGGAAAVSGVATLALGCISWNCLSNACYHLLSSQPQYVVVK